ncbi:DUF1707 domain-containing protein [Rhodococcus sp. BP-324]|uniref:DUF1707 SHOCT-like domain-containing protein n=1 Tax=Rhodococcus sp. BP-324 TaxID=2739503 RepID=UPI001C9AD610|nr:DUF1707 domain-containing protein [Rhodococcus sp. BP-324]MBY6422230.1 DUF1707 domain-containing protein [Rhodococcus sp. BP-324]
MTEPWMRASDADRSRVVRALEREVGTGRLTLGEYSDRVAAALVGLLAAFTGSPAASAMTAMMPGMGCG